MDISNGSSSIYNVTDKLDVSFFIGPKNLMIQLSNLLTKITLTVLKTVEILGHEFQICKLKKRKYDVPLSNLDFAFAVFSSGSTSDTPKIIKVPHRCILPNIFDLR